MLRRKFPQEADCSRTPQKTSSLTCTFPASTGASSTPPTRRSHPQRDQEAHTSRGHLPQRDSLMRMVATLLQEQDDEWQVADHRYFSIESMRRIDSQLEGSETPRELLAAIA